MQSLTEKEVWKPQMYFSLPVSVAYLIAAGAVEDVPDEKSPKLAVSTLQIPGRHT
jgi:hypothetical protein